MIKTVDVVKKTVTIVGQSDDNTLKLLKRLELIGYTVYIIVR